jgi:hypothetical protein
MGAVKTDSRNMAAGLGAFGEPRTMVARPGVAGALSLSHFLPHAVWSVCDLLDSAEGFLFCFCCVFTAQELATKIAAYSRARMAWHHFIRPAKVDA